MRCSFPLSLRGLVTSGACRGRFRLERNCVHGNRSLQLLNALRILFRPVSIVGSEAGGLGRKCADVPSSHLFPENQPALTVLSENGRNPVIFAENRLTPRVATTKMIAIPLVGMPMI